MRVFSVFTWNSQLTLWIVLATTSSAVPACGQDADAPRHFLESVYGLYENHGSGIDFTGPKARGVLDPSLIALIHADQKALGPDEVGCWTATRSAAVRIGMESGILRLPFNR